MRHRSPWALSLALLVGVSAVAVAQETAPPQPAGNGWSLFGQPAPKKTAPPPAKMPVVESPTVLRNREKADFFRRVEVCRKLKEIALATQDADLERRVDQVREQLIDVYTRHTALLPVGNGADEQTLAGQLSSGDSAGRLTGDTARPTGSAVSQAPTREGGR